MFPGSLLSTIIGGTLSRYSSYFSALFNGVFYGLILWATFVAISRRLENEK
jgi:hypothetical protein